MEEKSFQNQKTNKPKTDQQVTVVVCSAGQGMRMGSGLPKSLHPVAGKPMLARILQSLKRAGLDQIRVVANKNHDRLVRPLVEAFKADIYFQREQKGTAMAILSAELKTCSGDVLILNGDHPLVTSQDLKKIIQQFYETQADVCIGSFRTENPKEYGRVIRRKGKVIAVVEHNALTPESKKVKEVNTGIYLIKKDWLNTCLPQINNQNSSQEYILTDIISVSAQNNKEIISVEVSEDSALGVNSQKDLALVTKKLFTRKLNHLMREGVIIIDPFNVYIEEDVQVGQGSVIYPGVYLKGYTQIGAFCAVEPHCFIADSVIGHSVLIRCGSYLESVEVGTQSVVGPYARLRPGTKIGDQCRVGNFVEMKKTHFGSRSQAGHFSYLGDAQVGEDVNIGCGTVTCNLNIDGKKYTTSIGHQVFVGSGTQLVAPVELADGSSTGAGSVITKNVPSEMLALSRVPQVHRKKPHRKEPDRKEPEAKNSGNNK